MPRRPRMRTRDSATAVLARVVLTPPRFRGALDGRSPSRDLGFVTDRCELSFRMEDAAAGPASGLGRSGPNTRTRQQEGGAGAHPRQSRLRTCCSADAAHLLCSLLRLVS